MEPVRGIEPLDADASRRLVGGDTKTAMMQDSPIYKGSDNQGVNTLYDND